MAEIPDMLAQAKIVSEATHSVVASPRACVKRPNQIPLFVATQEVDDGSVH